MTRVLTIATFLFITSLLTVSCGPTVNHRPLSAEDFAAIDFSMLFPERFWGDARPPDFEERIRAQAPIMRERFPNATNATLEDAPLQSILAISGGGANGAFGAGILAGWSESGRRPSFEVVTGVSTGAIIAPFAFLGSGYDPLLLDLYGSVTRRDIYTRKPWIDSLFGSSLADTQPLKDQIDAFVTPELVEAIAKEARLKRGLFIITTHLDARRPMVWDITSIALNRGADAVPLIRKILLASAAIPGFFPPVAIEWDVDGRSFTELHVDGAVTRDVFVYPAQIPVGRINELQGLTFQREVFVIRNGNTGVEYRPAPVTTQAIMERALRTVLLYKSNADIEQIYFLAQRDGMDFNVVSIPEGFRANGAQEFDPEYMQTLLEIGQEIGRRGDFWSKVPVGLKIE